MNIPEAPQPRIIRPQFQQPLAAPIAKNASDAGIWEYLGCTWSVVFPAGREPDPGLVRKIREEVDPSFVPLLCRKVFRSPAGTEEEVAYFVVGRCVPPYEWKHDEGKDPIKLTLVPGNFDYNPDWIFDLRTWSVPWAQGSWQKKAGVPEMPLQFGPDVYHWLLQDETLRRNWTKDEIKHEILDKREDEEKQRLESADKELTYALRQEWKEMKKAVSEGRFVPKPEDPKPFVEVHQ